MRNVSCFGSQFSQILPRVPHYTLAFKIRHLDTLININVRGETFLRSGIANRFAMHNFQSFFFTKRQFDFFPLCLRTIRNHKTLFMTKTDTAQRPQVRQHFFYFILSALIQAMILPVPDRVLRDDTKFSDIILRKMNGTQTEKEK